jgi:hypothetical protein
MIVDQLSQLLKVIVNKEGLPISLELKDEDVEDVIQAVKRILER